MRRRIFVALSACALIFGLTPAVSRAAGAPAQDNQEYKETYTGTLVGIGGAAGGRTATFTLRLNGTTSPQAVARYADLLRSKGQQALLDQLHDNDVGTFSVTGQTGRRVNFAYVQDTPQGKRVIILFERWLQFFELRNNTRSENYPFSYMEFSINGKEGGSGTFIGAAKVYFDKDDAGTLNVENFATYPLRVVEVEARREH